MVSVGVSRMGKTGIVFVEPGAKVNSEYYCQHVLGGSLLPDIRAKCQRYSWTLQQDGAPSHTARNTLDAVLGCPSADGMALVRRAAARRTH